MEQGNECELLIVGGGPAGYAAALYGARASLDTVVLEQGMPGGQIATSDEIDNYPGILHIGGAEIGQRMQEHAEEAGARTVYGMATAISPAEIGFSVQLGDRSITAGAVVAAMGATPRPGGFEGEDAFRGRGVSYCATCDGMFYRGKRVFVIGGGNTAVEEALYLSRIADRVTMVVRRDEFRASRGAVQRLGERGNIDVRLLTSIVRIEGQTFIERIAFRDNRTGEVSVEAFDPGSVGIFVATGQVPQTELVSGLVDLAPDGGIVTDDAMATRTPGLFAAGDIRSKGLRQVVTAAADGAIAATSAYRYLEGRL